MSCWYFVNSDRIASCRKYTLTELSRLKSKSNTNSFKSVCNHTSKGTGNPVFLRVRISVGTEFCNADLSTRLRDQPFTLKLGGSEAANSSIRKSSKGTLNSMEFAIVISDTAVHVVSGISIENSNPWFNSIDENWLLHRVFCGHEITVRTCIAHACMHTLGMLMPFKRRPQQLPFGNLSVWLSANSCHLLCPDCWSHDIRIGCTSHDGYVFSGMFWSPWPVSLRLRP